MNPRETARHGAAILALVLGLHASALGQSPATRAIVGATVHTGVGQPLPGASVLIRGERILGVGDDLALPPDVERIDGRGKVLTAGFIATQNPLGLVEVSLEPATNDQAAGEEGDPIRAAFSAEDGFNPRSTLIPVARRGGLTDALATPHAGLVGGTSAWVHLDGSLRPAGSVRSHVALHVRIDHATAQKSGGGRPSAWMRLREAFDDARLYQRQRAAYERRGLRAMRTSRLDLIRLGDALQARLPVVIQVSRASDILRALELAKDYRLRLVLAGAEEAWRVADRIADAKVPVIVVPLSNLPSSFAALGSRFDNAAVLQRAGVRVIITTRGAHGLHNLRQEAGNAIAHGLDRQAALRALTVEPAEAFGLAHEIGSVRPGALANLVLWSGDPFELGTRAERMWIRGKQVSLRSRQSELLDRYRRLPR
ncbi:MAG: amidohydrolase family protein [Proteobacteria bacterium]|nr:amidohydrolase family protein [Pseudomonadota bacterium]